MCSNVYLENVIVRSLEYYIAIEPVEIKKRTYDTEDHKNNAYKRLEIARGLYKELTYNETKRL